MYIFNFNVFWHKSPKLVFSSQCLYIINSFIFKETISLRLVIFFFNILHQICISLITQKSKIGKKYPYYPLLNQYQKHQRVLKTMFATFRPCPSFTDSHGIEPHFSEMTFLSSYLKYSASGFLVKTYYSQRKI